MGKEYLIKIFWGKLKGKNHGVTWGYLPYFIYPITQIPPTLFLTSVRPSSSPLPSKSPTPSSFVLNPTQLQTCPATSKRQITTEPLRCSFQKAINRWMISLTLQRTSHPMRPQALVVQRNLLRRVQSRAFLTLGSQHKLPPPPPSVTQEAESVVLKSTPPSLKPQTKAPQPPISETSPVGTTKTTTENPPTTPLVEAPMPTVTHRPPTTQVPASDDLASARKEVTKSTPLIVEEMTPTEKSKGQSTTEPASRTRQQKCASSSQTSFSPAKKVKPSSVGSP